MQQADFVFLRVLAFLSLFLFPFLVVVELEVFDLRVF